MHLGADRGVVGVGEAVEERVVERDLPEVARIVHEALALELLEGVAQHGLAHLLAVGKELLRVGAGRAIHREALP